MTDIDVIWQGWHAEELIGQGSYGKVYRMSRTELGHTSYAAGKLIEIPQDPSEIKMLADMGMDRLSMKSYFEDVAKGIINEIAAMESLKGASNVVAIEDYCLIEHEDSVGWTICIRMELLQSLVEYHKEAGFPDVQETVRMGMDICQALMNCEEVGIIHRDVKPENVFRSAFGNYKLGDFGISRQIESSSKSVYSQKGTGPYMAPEVIRGVKYGSNVDVYSLGIMLYRYLNNMRFPFLPAPPSPFTAEDMQTATLRRVRGDELPAPSEADEALSEIVLKACKGDTTERYQSARELHADLMAWSEGRYLTEGSRQKTGSYGESKHQANRGDEQPEEMFIDCNDEAFYASREQDIDIEVIDETDIGSDNGDMSPEEMSAPENQTVKIPLLVLPIVLVLGITLAVSFLPRLFASGGGGSSSSASEYVGAWYVPTDKDRHIILGANGNVWYRNDKHGTIASGTWTVIDKDAGAIKFILRAQDGKESLFEEGSAEFTRMAYVESPKKLSAQLYYSPSEWETYIKY